MYEIIRNVILSQSFILEDILAKIDIVWLQSKISNEQKEELVTLARENADMSSSVDILSKLQEIDERLKALEDKPADTPEEIETYEEYVPGKWYYTNDRVTFDGKNYICVAPAGVVCVWGPNEYPAHWQEITEESE